MFIKEKISDNYFLYRSEAHTFGTDAFLLANFSSPKHIHKVIDLGTGCGIVPLLILDRFKPAEISAIEIQKQAYEQFRQTIQDNHIEDKINLIFGDLREVQKHFQREYFDILTMNPPYFKQGHGRVSKSVDKAFARHDSECTTEDLAKAADYLLKNKGDAFFIQRIERLPEYIWTFKKYNFEAKLLQLIQGKKNTDPILFLIKFKKGAKPNLIAKTPLILRNSANEQSAELIKILGSYNNG
ncbi:MAG: methyltransferase [Clostridia bacterium]|nr:methyltransferase [Clostridia bacterium]